MKVDIYGSMPSKKEIRRQQRLILTLAILTILFASVSLFAFLTIDHQVLKGIIIGFGGGLGIIAGCAFVISLLI